MSDISTSPRFGFFDQQFDDVAELSDSVARRLDQFEERSQRIPTCRDKWVLSSALQKLIRRGKAGNAIAIAVRLHQLDPAYLPRRLPIIAVEDIGLGDLVACHDTLAICSSSRWWRTDPLQTISFVVGSLARAVKCRAACDAYCLAQVEGATTHMMPSLLSMNVNGLVDVVTDLQRSRLVRSNALRVLGGITVRRGGQYEVLSRISLDGLHRVATEMSMPPLVRWLMARHQRTAGLAAMLPIAIEAAAGRTVTPGGDFPHSLDFVEGVPLCAVDMFSEFGRAVLRDFFRSSRPIKEFAAEHIAKGSHIRLLNMAMFHAESSHLNAYLTSPGLQELRDDTERCEMVHLGMLRGAAQRHDLYAVLEAEAGFLANIRRHRLLLAAELIDEAELNFGGAGEA